MQDLLVERARRGDRDAFTALAARVVDGCYGQAYAILRDAELARDAVQAALLLNLLCPDRTARCDFEDGGSLGYGAGNRLILLVTSVGDTPVVAGGSASATEWATFGTDVEAFLRSIEFPA